MSPNNGKHLEKVVEYICTHVVEKASVKRDVRIQGKSGRMRQIDILVEGKVGPCTVKIELDAKDYGTRPVGIHDVEALATKIQDTTMDLGVIVCPKGFDEGARAIARNNRIQLLEPISPDLENVPPLFFPIRAVIPTITRTEYRFQHRERGEHSMPIDLDRIRVKIGNKDATLDDLAKHAWNTGQIKQKEGVQEVPMNAMTFYDIQHPEKIGYVEITLRATVKEHFYVGVVPALGFRNISDGENYYGIRIDADKIETEWKEYSSLDEANSAANELPNQPEDVKDLLIRPETRFHIEGLDSD